MATDAAILATALALADEYGLTFVAAFDEEQHPREHGRFTVKDVAVEEAPTLAHSDYITDAQQLQLQDIQREIGNLLPGASIEISMLNPDLAPQLKESVERFANEFPKAAEQIKELTVGGVNGRVMGQWDRSAGALTFNAQLFGQRPLDTALGRGKFEERRTGVQQTEMNKAGSFHPLDDAQSTFDHELGHVVFDTANREATLQIGESGERAFAQFGRQPEDDFSARLMGYDPNKQFERQPYGLPTERPKSEWQPPTRTIQAAMKAVGTTYGSKSYTAKDWSGGYLTASHSINEGFAEWFSVRQRESMQAELADRTRPIIGDAFNNVLDYAHAANDRAAATQAAFDPEFGSGHVVTCRGYVPSEEWEAMTAAEQEALLPQADAAQAAVILVDAYGDPWSIEEFALDVAARLGYSEGQSRDSSGRFGEGDGTSTKGGKTRDGKSVGSLTKNGGMIVSGGKEVKLGDKVTVHSDNVLHEMMMPHGERGRVVELDRGQGLGVKIKGDGEVTVKPKDVEKGHGKGAGQEGHIVFMVDHGERLAHDAAVFNAMFGGKGPKASQLATVDLHWGPWLAYSDTQERGQPGNAGQFGPGGGGAGTGQNEKTAEIDAIKVLGAPIASMQHLSPELQAKVTANVTKNISDPPEAARERMAGYMERAGPPTPDNPGGGKAWQEGAVWYQSEHDRAQAIADMHGSTVENVAGALAVMSAGTKWETEQPIVAGMLTMDKGNIDMSPEKLAECNARLDKMGLDRVENGTPYASLPVRDATVVMHSQYNENNNDPALSWGVKYSFSQYERSLEILRSDTVDDRVHGPKVREFYNNLANPQLGDHVTIDVDMMRAASGNPKLENNSRITGAPSVSVTTTNQETGEKTTEKSAIGPIPLLADQVRDIATQYGVTPQQAQAIIWTQWKQENGV